MLLYEIHPVADMFEPEPGASPPAPRYSYFEQGPVAESSGLDYYGNTKYASRTHYSFHHTLGDIFEGCLGAGFAIRSFREYGHDIANIFASFANMEVRLPLCYTLVVERER